MGTIKAVALAARIITHQPEHNWCATIQEPTLNIIAICEPSIGWLHPGACLMCVIKRGKK